MQLTETVDPKDILSREIIFNGDLHKVALAMIPWLRRNPKFRLLEAMDVAGISARDLMQQKHLLPKLKTALRKLGCRYLVNETATPYDDRIWFFPDEVLLSPGVDERITERGFSEDADEPPPQATQIEVCRTWLKEHARPRVVMNTKFSSESLKKLVEGWTRDTRMFVDREQINEYTGEKFFDDFFYCSNGAFIQAAVDEGYQVKRLPEYSPNAWFNMTVRKTGKSWKGRTSRLVTGEAPKRKVRPSDIITPVLIRQRLAAFLDQIKEGSEGDNLLLRFHIKDACSAAGVPYPKRPRRGRPPVLVTEALRSLGCTHRLELIRGVRQRRWFRIADMPLFWQQTLAIEARAKERVLPADEAHEDAL